MRNNYFSFWRREPVTHFVVRYNHRKSQTVGSLREALWLVQEEAGQPVVVQVDTRSNDVCCYRTQESAAVGNVGVNAFAAISEYRY